MAVRREATNSPVMQGKDEAITYFMNFTPWGASANTPVSAPDVKIFDVDGVDVSATKLSGSPSVVNDVYIYFPRLSGLLRGERYRIECQVTLNNDTWEGWAYIDGED